MKYKIYTLGCKVNTYESNVMSDLLENNGYTLGEEPVDVAIINTCTVTNQADNKSAKIIRHAIKQNPGATILVCGCMAQNKPEIVKDIKGVNIVLGNVNKSKIIDYLKAYQGNQICDVKKLENLEFEAMKLNNFNRTRAFIQIQNGCNNFCSYCVIPYVRGNERSKNKDDVLEEIKTLVAKGHKEIVLTGIHTGNYGFPDYSFADLLNDIIKIDLLERLRISSIEVTELDDDVLKVLNSSKVLVDHLHIPLQSGSNSVLKRMNRKYDKEYFIEKMKKIREIRPNISITTDVIVGFPGETEEEFKETIETIKEVNFSKLHVFPYSKRDKTEAALMENHVSEEVKKERSHVLLALSKELELNYMKNFLDKEVVFIPEVMKDGMLIGHTGNYLLVKACGNRELINQNVTVKLCDISYPYMVGIID